MKSMKFTLDMITPGLCGGADPVSQAEIRPPSIRGQLRWWFRALGGFASLYSQSVYQQEAEIFGSVAEKIGRASILQVRTRLTRPVQTMMKNAADLNANMNSPKGYLLFPLRDRKRKMFTSTDLPSFELHISWRGKDRLFDDILALITMFGSLGALGSRSRRGFGALAFQPGEQPMSLTGALARFGNPKGIHIREQTVLYSDHDEALDALSQWLKGWRSHGRTPNLSKGPGIEYAKHDHDSGLGKRINGETFRPAIGLPIVQFYSSTRTRVNWDYEAKGRFASPVILRPYRLPDGKYKALVIFAEAHKWPKDKKVYLSNLGERRVSLALYNAMKADPNLRPFEG